MPSAREPVSLAMKVTSGAETPAGTAKRPRKTAVR
jgi:hypothetical protein